MCEGISLIAPSKKIVEIAESFDKLDEYMEDLKGRFLKTDFAAQKTDRGELISDEELEIIVDIMAEMAYAQAAWADIMKKQNEFIEKEEAFLGALFSFSKIVGTKMEYGRQEGE